MQAVNQGVKFDARKPRTDLITWEGLIDLDGYITTMDDEPVLLGVDDALEYLHEWWQGADRQLLVASMGELLSCLQRELNPVAAVRRNNSIMSRFPVALLAIGQVLAYGAEKYAARNWEQGLAYSRVYAAAQRHLLAYLSGQTLDPETGLPHLAHAGCCLMFLLTFEARGMAAKLDDRPSKREAP